MTHPMFCIVITSDNADPRVYGPFATEAAADAWKERNGAAFYRDHHVEALTLRSLKQP